jgi:hypothetical protein
MIDSSKMTTEEVGTPTPEKYGKQESYFKCTDVALNAHTIIMKALNTPLTEEAYDQVYDAFDLIVNELKSGKWPLGSKEAITLSGHRDALQKVVLHPDYREFQKAAFQKRTSSSTPGSFS